MTTIRPPVRTRLTAATATLLIASGLFTGCASEEPPAPKPATTTPLPRQRPASLSTIKTELQTAKARLQSTMEALNVLQKNPSADAPANYNKFMDEYRGLKSAAEAVSSRSRDLKDHVANYRAVWTREVGVVDPQLRQQAAQQKADAERIFGTVNSEMQLASKSFQPLMANLTELADNLRGNLAPATLSSIADPVAKANAQSEEVTTHAAAIITAIEEISASTGETRGR